jgi:spore germination cell wall hydrolase CwlJ-like protein
MELEDTPWYISYLLFTAQLYGIRAYEKKMKYILALILSIFVATTAHAKSPDEQIRCLATNMYYEAASEGEKGMAAVGHVVMNRVESGKFPSSPCAVIYQKSKSSCQFSWVCGKKPTINREKYNSAVLLATKIYLGNSVDITRGALYFHAAYVRPYWARVSQRTIRIGNHIFYRG